MDNSVTIAINFNLSKDAEEERVMHATSNNMKFTPYIDANEVIDEQFQSIPSRYQGNWETSLRGGYFILDSVQLMYYKCHKVNFICCASYIDSSDWINKKKTTTYAINIDGKCFQYASTVALNYEEIKWNPE